MQICTAGSFQVKSSCFMPPCPVIWNTFAMSLFDNNNNLGNLLRQALLARSFFACHNLSFECMYACIIIKQNKQLNKLN